MFAQLKFDLKKNLFSSTNAVVYVAFVLLLLTTFFLALDQTDSTARDVDGAYQAALQSVTGTIKTLEKDHAKTAKQTAQLNQKYTQRDYLQEIMTLNASVSSPVPMNTPTQLDGALLKYARYNLKKTRQGQTKGLVLIDHPDRPTDPTLLGQQKEVTFYRYLALHHLRELPLTQTDVPAAAYLPFQFLRHVSPLLILGVFALQLGQLFTTEKRTGTIRFMNNLPVNKLGLLTARMGTFLVLTLPLFGFALLTVYLIVGLKFGWGNWQYPLVYSPDGRHVAIMTMAKFMGLLILILLAAVLFMMMLSALVSLFSGNFGVNLAVCAAVLLFGTNQVAGSSVGRGVARWLPSGYFDFSGVITHQTAWPIFSIAGGIVVLLAWAAALYGLCAVIVSRRQRL